MTSMYAASTRSSHGPDGAAPCATPPCSLGTPCSPTPPDHPASPPADASSDQPLQRACGPLFEGIAPADRARMLTCLDAQVRHYRRGEAALRRGDRVRSLGLVLDGRLTMERTDVLGNRSILGSVAAGDVFAEAFAATGSPAGVDVVAATDCCVAHVDLARVLRTCSNACAFHEQLVRNLFAAMGRRNMALTRKIADITPRTIRGRLTSYLSDQARDTDASGVFRIPYSRQQLADYLCVDRSALSTELSRMRAEGLVDFDKNAFWFPRRG